jgi:hypothetical protein
MGPALRVIRGDVVVMDRADPDAPNRTVRGARRYDPIRAMATRGDLDPAHYVAAERFRSDHEMAEGAREKTGGGTAAWQRCYSDRQLDAVAARAAALQVIGLRCGAVFVALVLECLPLRGAERSLNMRSGAATPIIREALTRLSAHYDKCA